jgi:hypothetical protein
VSDVDVEVVSESDDEDNVEPVRVRRSGRVRRQPGWMTDGTYHLYMQKARTGKLKKMRNLTRSRYSQLCIMHQQALQQALQYSASVCQLLFRVDK